MTAVGFNVPTRPLVHVSTVSALRAATSSLFVEGMTATTTSAPANALWSWSATSGATDDGKTVVKPSDVGAGLGRWLLRGVVPLSVSQVSVDAKIFAVADGSTDDFANLQAAAASLNEVVYTGPTDYKIASSGTIGTAASVHVFSADAGMLHITGALVLRGQVKASRKVFNVTGGGSLSLPDVANVDLTWGTVGDGAADDTAGAQAMIGATADGCTLSVPPRSHRVTGGIIQATRINVIGHGPASIFLVDAGVAGTADIFTLKPGVGVVLDGVKHEDFAIIPASGTPGRHGIVVDVTADGCGVARHRIKRVYVFQLGGRAFEVLNLPAKADGWFTSSIEECIGLGGLNLVNSGDSIVVRKNVFTGNGWGIEVQSVVLFTNPEAIKKSIATSASPQTYSGGALDGPIGTTLMIPAQQATVTTAVHSGSYVLSAITIHGTDSSNATVSDTVTPTLVTGGETLTTTQAFKTITSIDVPAQVDGLGHFQFGTSTLEEYASSCVIEENNITGQGGSVLVHSGDQVIVRKNNVEHFGTALGNGAIDLRGDWHQLRAPVVADNFATAYGAGTTTLDVSMNGLVLPQASIHVGSTAGFPSAGTIYVTTSAGKQPVTYTSKDSTHFLGCTGGTGTMSTGGFIADKLSVVNVDNCMQARVEHNTLGRGIGGLITINVTGNSLNATLEDNAPGSVLDYDVDFINDAGTNTKMWGKYRLGVGPGPLPGSAQPSSGVAVDIVANLGSGFADGTYSTTVDKEVATISFLWSPKTTNIPTSDLEITTQGQSFVGATGGNRDSGAIVCRAPTPQAGGACRPWAIILGGTTRFQVGDGGAALSSQPGQTTVLGDIDNGDEIQISHASGMVLQGQAGVVSGVQSFNTLGPQGEVALTTDVTFAPSAVFFDMLTASITTVAGSLEIDFRVCGTVTVGTVGFRLVLDGTPIASATGNIQAVGFSQSTSVLRHVSVTAGTHSVKVQYIAPAGSLNVSAATGNESASLFVRQS